MVAEYLSHYRTFWPPAAVLTIEDAPSRDAYAFEAHHAHLIASQLRAAGIDPILEAYYARRFSIPTKLAMELEVDGGADDPRWRRCDIWAVDILRLMTAPKGLDRRRRREQHTLWDRLVRPSAFHWDQHNHLDGPFSKFLS